MNWFVWISLAALALIGAKLTEWADWSWWVITAPLWLYCVVLLVAGAPLILFLLQRPRK